MSIIIERNPWCKIENDKLRILGIIDREAEAIYQMGKTDGCKEAVEIVKNFHALSTKEFQKEYGTDSMIEAIRCIGLSDQERGKVNES